MRQDDLLPVLLSGSGSYQLLVPYEVQPLVVHSRVVAGIVGINIVMQDYLGAPIVTPVHGSDSFSTAYPLPAGVGGPCRPPASGSYMLKEQGHYGKDSVLR